MAHIASAAMGAYAGVGFLEVLLGSRLQLASERWASMASWKRAMISTLVVLASLVLAIGLMPYFAAL